MTALRSVPLALAVACSSPPAALPSPEPSPVPSVAVTASPSPSPAPEPTPTPGPRPVTLRADQVIMPLNELPLGGYKVAGDDGKGFYWRRTFDPLGRIGAEYAYVDVSVTILGSAALAKSWMDDWGCVASAEHGGTIGGKGPKSATLVSAPATGDASAACAYGWESGDVKFDYYLTSRNVYIWVQVAPFRLPNLTQSMTVGHAVEIARRQLAIVDRVSPP